MKQTGSKFKGRSGFTLVEVICVLVLVGIIALVAIARVMSTRDVDLATQLEVVKGHLRIAQSKAMSAGSPWGINFNSSTTYYLFQGIGSTNPILLPGDNSANNIVDLTAKNSALTITPPSSNPVTFDAYGSPGPNTITITTNGGSITITRNTGFIP